MSENEVSGEKEENLVKKTCKELGITQKELAEKIGMSESGLKTAITRNSFSSQIKNSIQLLIENHNLKKEVEKSQNFKKNLKEYLLS